MGPAIGVRRRRFFAVGAACVAISSCAQAPRETFDLSGAAGVERWRFNVKSALAVSEPKAAAPIDSDRIVVRAADGGVAVLPGAQWSDRLPRLAQGRLVSVIRRQGLSAAFPGAVVDAQLSSDLRRFEIDAARGAAVVEIAAQLIDDKTGRERAAAVFRGVAPAPGVSGAQAAPALEKALDSAAREIAAWARVKLRDSGKRGG